MDKTPRLYHMGSGKTGHYASFTREGLLAQILTGEFVPQPPDWWFRIQAEKGRSTNAAASIWHKNYPAARKFVVWDQAPEEDFFARGYRWSL